MADSKPSRDRKRTPDVLAELLSADLPPAAPPPVAPQASQPAAAKGARKPQPPREPKPREPGPLDAASEQWEVEIVSCQDHRGWRARYVNGAELKDWLTGALIHDYVNNRGGDGWELAGASSHPRLYGVADSLQLYFKRHK